MSIDYDKLQAIGKSAAECIAEMVAALECNYDRLAELKEMHEDYLRDNPGKYLDPKDKRSNWYLAHTDESEELAELAEAAGDCESREDAERRIQEDPLSVEVRCSEWHGPGEEPGQPDEFCILLGTGGPATRIVGDLDGERQPFRCHIESQDWGTQWTEYTGDRGERDYLLTYCQQFYFGE